MMKKRIKRYITGKMVGKERANEENIVMAPVPATAREPLTGAEKQAVDKMWSKVAGGGYLSYKELEVYKHFNGFDPRYLGHNLYLPLVARRLNDYHYTKFFEDKGLLGRLSCEIATPKCLVRCIGGEYYSSEFEQIGRQEAERICMAYGEDMIIKPSRESSGGQNIMKLTPAQWQQGGRFDQIVQSYGRDWVAQECIRQHPSLVVFNPDSINTVRITSLYLNGKASICSSVLRFGAAGTVTDNWCSGGKMIGVQDDGALCRSAINNKLGLFDEIDGKKFTGISLPFLPKLHETVLRAHVRDFSLCRLIGWDIGIDQEGLPVAIEINSSQPGIFAEQICTGPIFGDRTEEVIDYVAGKEFRYGRGFLNI